MGWLFAIGTLILGGIALFSRNKQQKEAAELQLEKDILGLKEDIADYTTDLATTRIAIAEAEANIGNVEDWLTLYPQYAEKEKTQMELAGSRQYRELMENYGMMNVLAGATGRVAAGTSMAIKGEQAREDVVAFVGEDLTFDPEGGLYGMTWAELLQNLEAEYTGQQRQLDIYETALTELTETETELETLIEEAEEQLGEWEEELGEEEDFDVQPLDTDIVEPPDIIDIGSGRPQI